MEHLHCVLLTVAVIGWLAAATAHVLARIREPTDTWETRRNLCLLCSSICMNTLAVSVIRRRIQRIRSLGSA